jgi:hypothetical protein
MIRCGEATGTTILREAFRRGNVQAGIALALHHKRHREWDLAAEAWERLMSSSRSLLAAVELAKHHEHRTRRYEAALRLVESALSWDLPLDARARREILKRRARLERKLRRQEARSGTL